MPWHVWMLSVMYQRIGNMPKACPYVMMNRKLDSHPLRFMVCFFGGNVDGGGWQNDMGNVKKCEIG